MNAPRHPRNFDDQYDDGLDDEVSRITRTRRTELRSEMKTKEELEAELPPARPFWMDLQLMSVPLFAGFVFGILGAVAAGSVHFTLRAFAEEGGVNPIIFVAVPALFAMLFAIVIYQQGQAKITQVAQSISRGILVALLTWASFSALATWVWCAPADYGACYGNFLLVSGIVGGGPMLAAALVAGALVGWLIKQKRLAWIME